MNIKASTRYIVEERDTTLLLQVDLMDNNTASQIIGLPSFKDPQEKKATMVKKCIKIPHTLENSSGCSATVNTSKFSISYKMKPKKN